MQRRAGCHSAPAFFASWEDASGMLGRHPTGKSSKTCQAPLCKKYSDFPNLFLAV
jgi:hypothetical protein